MHNKKIITFSGKPASKRVLLSIIQFSYLAVFYIGINIADSLTNEQDILYCISALITCLFVLEILTMRYITGSIANKISLFNIIVFLFSTGRYLLYFLGINVEGYDVFSRIQTTTLIKAGKYIILCYIMFVWGSTLLGERNESDKDNKVVYSEEEYTRKAYKWAIVFIVVGVIPFLYTNYNNLTIVLRSGYSAYYKTDTRVSSFVSFFSNYFLVGLYLLFYSADNNRKRMITIVLLLMFSVFRLLCGDRGDAISMLLSVYLLYSMFKEKRKSSIVLIAVVIFSLSSVSIISTWRHQAYQGQSLVEIIKYSFEHDNIFVSTLNNLGGTIFPLAKVIEIVPLVRDFLYGGSYLASFVYLIPSFLRIGVIESIMLQKEYSSPATWLMNTLNMSYGPGFTPFAEAYLNFGEIGIPCMFFIGMLFSYVISFKLKKAPRRYNTVMNCFAFYMFAMATRGSINYVLIYFFRYILIPYLCINYIRNPLSKR